MQAINQELGVGQAVHQMPQQALYRQQRFLAFG
jgi:hypothetical protein